MYACMYVCIEMEQTSQITLILQIAKYINPLPTTSTTIKQYCTDIYTHLMSKESRSDHLYDVYVDPIRGGHGTCSQLTMFTVCVYGMCESMILNKYYWLPQQIIYKIKAALADNLQSNTG